VRRVPWGWGRLAVPRAWCKGTPLEDLGLLTVDQRTRPCAWRHRTLALGSASLHRQSHADHGSHRVSWSLEAPSAVQLLLVAQLPMLIPGWGRASRGSGRMLPGPGQPPGSCRRPAGLSVPRRCWWGCGALWRWWRRQQCAVAVSAAGGSGGGFFTPLRGSGSAGRSRGDVLLSHWRQNLAIAGQPGRTAGMLGAGGRAGWETGCWCAPGPGAGWWWCAPGGGGHGCKQALETALGCYPVDLNNSLYEFCALALAGLSLVGSSFSEEQKQTAAADCSQWLLVVRRLAGSRSQLRLVADCW